MRQRIISVILGFAALTLPAQALEKVGEQRLFGQCTALVLKGKNQTCGSVTLGHNDDGRSYFEIPSNDDTLLIGGRRMIQGSRMSLEIDSLDPGTGTGEAALGDCQMQLSTDLVSLQGLTCKGSGGQTGQFLFVFKPTTQRIDGALPAR